MVLSFVVLGSKDTRDRKDKSVSRLIFSTFFRFTFVLSRFMYSGRYLHWPYFPLRIYFALQFSISYSVALAECVIQNVTTTVSKTYT